MITAIEIENLRGIRTGRLEGLTPLTILTGPNSCGKSTVLDGLLIGADDNLPAAVMQAVERHPNVLEGSRWLFRAPGSQALLQLQDHRKKWQRHLVWKRVDVAPERLGPQARPPFSTIEISGDWGEAQVSFSSGRSSGLQSSAGEPSPFVCLVDPGLPIPLHRMFAEVARTGRRQDVYDLLGVLVPDFERLEILVDDNDTPSLYLTRQGSGAVPLGLSGDGIQAFVQLALGIAVAPEGLVLLEEPEVYQHPKAIWQTARALIANMRRGVQIVLTTHSLELIDALLGVAEDDDLEKISVFNLLLEDGELRSGHRVGEEIAFARQTLENDLR